MVKEIIRDEEFLAIKAEPADENDIGVCDDLLDTLEANKERCVGLAANMIGVSKSIIVFSNEGKFEEMLNPMLVQGREMYNAEEACLSLDGVRKTKRFKRIKVRWQTRTFETRTKNFSGWTAEIIQHELDHINGIII